MGEMRITNIQDTLMKADLVQRLQEALLSQARMAQSESNPLGMERAREAVETLVQSRETSDATIRDEEQGRREPFLAKRGKKKEPEEEDEEKPRPEPGDEGAIIDIEA